MQVEVRNCTPFGLGAAALVAGNSFCPSSNWLDRVSHSLGGHDERLILVSAGANKGFGVLSALQRWGQSNVSAADWMYQLQGHVRLVHAAPSRQLCGFCCPCRAPFPQPARPRPVYVHAFEPLAENYRWLRRAVNAFGLNGSVALAHAALSNVAGTLHMPSKMVVGKENVVPRLTEWGRRDLAVPSLRLDDYIEERQIERIHLASFDAESWDPYILEGMNRSLAKGIVDVFEFEIFNFENALRNGSQASDPNFHPHPRPRLHPHFENALRNGSQASDPRRGRDGPASQGLAALLEWLHAFRYDCFWQGNNGCVAPASPPCADVGGLRGQKLTSPGNLVCAYDRPGGRERRERHGRDAPRHSHEHSHEHSLPPAESLWALAEQCAAEAREPSKGTSVFALGEACAAPAKAT